MPGSYLDGRIWRQPYRRQILTSKVGRRTETLGLKVSVPLTHVSVFFCYRAKVRCTNWNHQPHSYCQYHARCNHDTCLQKTSQSWERHPDHILELWKLPVCYNLYSHTAIYIPYTTQFRRLHRETCVLSNLTKIGVCKNTPQPILLSCTTFFRSFELEQSTICWKLRVQANRHLKSGYFPALYWMSPCPTKK